METLDPTEIWLNNVAMAHSNSTATSILYRRYLKWFCEFLGKTPQQILDDYEATTDREFRRRYARYLKAYSSSLFQQKYAPSTIHGAVAAVKSFFKYSDLPIGYVPTARVRVTYHNRDISKEEIKLIVDSSQVRQRAFYLLMAQGGLRPYTICRLKYKHLKEDYEKGTIPLCIKVPEELAKGKTRSYFTFIGKEGFDHLKAHLNTMPDISDDDYIFVNQGTTDPVNSRSVSGLFRRTVTALEEKGLLEVHQEEEGKPRDIRLYNLRKFFRKHAGHAGADFVNFWMGHTANYKAPHIPASDASYFPKDDVEFHRARYKKDAMPHLTIYTPTVSETGRTIKKLEEELEKERKRSAATRKAFDDTTAEQRKTIDELREQVEQHEQIFAILRKKIEELGQQREKK